jgi:hypothetical protein
MVLGPGFAIEPLVPQNLACTLGASFAARSQAVRGVSVLLLVEGDKIDAISQAPCVNQARSAWSFADIEARLASMFFRE